MTTDNDRAWRGAERRMELIRSLYRLADWVADHPELPLPTVEAIVSPPSGQSWETECAAVDAVAAALNVTPTSKNGHYRAGGSFGPVAVSSTAITARRMAEWDAMTSYRGSVLPAAVDGGDAA